MFQLNPFNLTDAWWQHMLMFLVSAVLGFIIAYRRGQPRLLELRQHIETTELSLVKCLHHDRPSGALALPIPTDDDLKKIEGIGPQIEKLLQQAHIRTYQELSITSVEAIRYILDAAGPGFQMHDPATWPMQARLAHGGLWDELLEWQKELNGGKV